MDKSQTNKQRQATRREESIKRLMATCVHFRGVSHETCHAGVNLHEQFGEGPGCFANIACTQAYPNDFVPMKQCPLVKYPTRAEAEEKEKERAEQQKKAMEAVIAAHEDAKAKGFGRGRGGVGEVKCPLCSQGMIRYSVASCNGHMHGRCTSGCVSWME